MPRRKTSNTSPEPPAVSFSFDHIFPIELLVCLVARQWLIQTSFKRKRAQSGLHLAGRAPDAWSRIPAMSAVDRVVRRSPLLHILLHCFPFALGGCPAADPLRIRCESTHDMADTMLALNIEKSAKCSHCVAGHHKCEDVRGPSSHHCRCLFLVFLLLDCLRRRHAIAYNTPAEHLLYIAACRQRWQNQACRARRCGCIPQSVPGRGGQCFIAKSFTDQVFFFPRSALVCIMREISEFERVLSQRQLCRLAGLLTSPTLLK